MFENFRQCMNTREEKVRNEDKCNSTPTQPHSPNPHPTVSASKRKLVSANGLESAMVYCRHTYP